MGFEYLKAILILVVARTSISAAVISSMDFTTNVIYLGYSYSNTVGLSFEFP